MAWLAPAATTNWSKEVYDDNLESKSMHIQQGDTAVYIASRQDMQGIACAAINDTRSS
jgi:activator of HSP90 ATPase